MKKYRVWVKITGYVDYYVNADSADDAGEKAIGLADASDCDDWEYDYNYTDIEEVYDEDEC